MAKKHDYSAEYEQLVDNTKIENVEINEELKNSFIAYAMAVNVSRAIPDVRDGLKPVHRRILYDMNEIGMTFDKPHKKCARIVGDVLGKYHPHGDSSVYGALVRLAQDFSIRYPLVDGHGNFGSVDGDPPAAYRYTEARMSKIADEMLRDIDKDTVDFTPNFDGEHMEPVVLPSRFPNLLVNGSDGIAVGMATNIPPHNLREVTNAIVAQIKNPDIDIEELLTYVSAPDYPTGGIILNRAGLKNAYVTGKGNVVVRAQTHIEEEHDRERIVITELPYQVNKAELLKTMANLVKNKRIEGIADIKEESDRKGMRVVVDVKQGYQPQVVLNTLFKHTPLQSSFGINFLALADGMPKILNLKQMLAYYIAHQEQIIVRRTKYDLAKAEERAHILEGLVTALANIDEVIKIIKASTDRVDATAKLQEAFLLSDKQAGAILDMRLQRLTSLEVEKLNEELETIRGLIVEYRGILASEDKVKQIIIDELTEIADKYGDDRKSEVRADLGDIDLEDLIEKEDIVISMTHFGYIKRIPVSEYRSQARGGVGTTGHKPKEEDFVERMFISNTHDNIMFFTNLGKVYTIKGYEIPEGQKSARGRAMVNLLNLGEGEKVTMMLAQDAMEEGYLVIATKNGMIKKTDVKEYAHINKNGKKAISLAEGDELINVEYSTGNDDIMVASSSGKIIRFNENGIRPLARDTMGVKAMALAEDEYLVDMLVLKPDTKIFTVTENGYGKLTSQGEYRTQSRNGKGIMAGKFNEKTGKLVGLKQITENDDIMLISNNGIILRTPADSISLISRSTQGVKVMRLREDDKVVCLAIADKIAEDQTEENDVDAIEIDETINTEE
jgi:DNA gyrase subunit A